jgi:hypothetical protein
MLRVALQLRSASEQPEKERENALTPGQPMLCIWLLKLPFCYCETNTNALS